MTATNFERIVNWSRKGPIVKVVFEMFNKQNRSLGTQTKKLLFDSGCEDGIILPFTEIEDFGIDSNSLFSVTVSSPGTPSNLQRACIAIVNEINLDGYNILEKPMEKKMPVIFSSNPKQTPVIGQTAFFDFKCCIDYKNEKFSIDK